MEQVPSPRVVDYPVYSTVSEFLSLMDGHSAKTLKTMMATIREQRGNPQETKDWSNPDQWIPAILSGDEQALALYLWHESNRQIRPRYVEVVSRFSSIHGLIEPDHTNMMHITEAGRGFLDGTQIKQIDYLEGLVHLLTNKSAITL